jgi:hypothetical protein
VGEDLRTILRLGAERSLKRPRDALLSVVVGAVLLVGCGSKSEAEQQLDRWCERVGVALAQFFAETEGNAPGPGIWPPPGFTLEDIRRADRVCNDAEPTVGFYAQDGR